MKSKKMKRVFIIRPVRGISAQYAKKIETEIELIRKYYEVYDPIKDTDQNDQKGLYICKQNRTAIKNADLVIVFWDGKSQGCLFDLGMAFALNKNVLPWNDYFPPEDENGKSFWNMVWTWYKEPQQRRKIKNDDDESNKKIQKLRKIIEDTFWMAIRYAHGRHTFAPTIIRDALKELEEIFPDFTLKHDDTIQPPTEEELKQHLSVREDWLDDLFKFKLIRRANNENSHRSKNRRI